MTIEARVERVRERVAAAAERSGRTAGDLRIVAVVKGVDVALVREAVEAGIADLGENRPRDLADKASALGRPAAWHFVGGLQTNKVRHLDPAALIHSIDRDREGAALQARGERTGRMWDVLVEVNVAGEASKQGVSPDHVEALLEDLAAYPLVRPRGFMLMAPQVENPEDVRWVFTEGRRLRERFVHLGLVELSMGMSDDFEVAVEEGATIVRIGRAIFQGEEN